MPLENIARPACRHGTAVIESVYRHQIRPVTENGAADDYAGAWARAPAAPSWWTAPGQSQDPWSRGNDKRPIQ
ncbi:hypothetical protein FDA94_08820 [Herbidospora galbida]|uniref:Uncharacterized protein n=1 Tax=Herbidospora galbida TaxID=2575442 RepID=A0A4U3MJ17_9ACTN|nr:hypothetical protein FDA94_08820 [Herbidospora galbida]